MIKHLPENCFKNFDSFRDWVTKNLSGDPYTMGLHLNFKVEKNIYRLGVYRGHEGGIDCQLISLSHYLPGLSDPNILTDTWHRGFNDILQEFYSYYH